MTRWHIRGWILVLLALAAGRQVSAQGFQGSLRGVVQDDQGKAVGGVTVKLTNEGTGETRTQVTSNQGTVTFSNLLVGQYALETEAQGFKKYERRRVSVSANQVTDVSLRLELGALTETVTVTGTDLVQTTSSQLEGGTFGAREITDIPVYDPLLTGDPTNFAMLAPGVGTQSGGVTGQGGTIGGNRPRNNNFVMDGLDNNDPGVTGAVAPVIQDAVEEFTLLTNQFSAEFGHSTAGQFITTTKSGTNEFHGALWEYNVNRHMLSLDNLTRATFPEGGEKPRLDFNRFGASLGGPILKDKWFVFGAVEYQNLNQQGSAVAEISVPTAAGLATLEGLAANPGSGVSPINVGILRDHVPTASARTGTFNVLNEATGQQVPVEVGTFSATTPNYTRTKLAHLNTDYDAGSHRLSARVALARASSISAGDLPTAEFNSNTSAETTRVTLGDVWTVRSDLVNELRVGYTKKVQNFPVDLPPAPGRTDVFANYAIDELALFIGPQSNYPQTGDDYTFQVAESLTYIRGAHVFKVGAEYRAIGGTTGFLPRARGEYGYATLDDFVHDKIPTGSNGALRGAGRSDFNGARNAFYGFLQDSWKVRPRVTLDLGLRYELTAVAKDNAAQELNAIANIDSIRGETDANGRNIFNSLTPAHQQLLLDTVGESMIFRNPASDKNNFAPRLGFAWDIEGNGRTSLRGGFAIAHDVLFGNFDTLSFPPQYQVETNTSIACSLSPSPAWCANRNDVRHSTGGFLAGGGILNVVNPQSSVDRAAARASTTAYVKDQTVPQTTTWSLSLQRQLAEDYLVEVRYVGTRGNNQPLQIRYNAGIPVPVQLPIFRTREDAQSRPYAGAPTLAAFNNARLPLLAPYGFLGTVTVFDPVGKSWYDGVSVAFKRRFVKGFAFDAHYTYSKTQDYGENEVFTSLMNPRRLDDSWDVASNKGLSGLHKPHKAVLAWQWELPRAGSTGVLGALTNGWLLNGVFLYESGQALSLLAGVDQNGNGDSAGDRAWENPSGIENTGTGVTTVCWVPGSTTFGCNTPSQIVGYVANDPNAQFVKGAVGAGVGVGLDKTPRGRILGPGSINFLNLSLYKRIGLGGSRNMRVGVDAINVTNTPSYSLGTGSAIAPANNGAATVSNVFVVPGNPQFLDKTTFSGGLGQNPYQRVIQFQAKFTF